MKKFTCFFLLIIIFIPNIVFSFNKEEFDSANYLAYKWIITSKELISEYNLDSNITRREMLKIMFNLSWKYVNEWCSWKFSDLNKNDWGCKYAETALKNKMIAWNQSYRPDDMVTKAEALKMIFKWVWFKKNNNWTWEEWYVSAAIEKWILDSSFNNYKINAKRWWIFILSKNTLLLWNDEDINILKFFINN